MRNVLSLNSRCPLLPFLFISASLFYCLNCFFFVSFTLNSFHNLAPTAHTINIYPGLFFANLSHPYTHPSRRSVHLDRTLDFFFFFTPDLHPNLPYSFFFHLLIPSSFLRDFSFLFFLSLGGDFHAQIISPTIDGVRLIKEGKCETASLLIESTFYPPLVTLSFLPYSPSSKFDHPHPQNLFTLPTLITFGSLLFTI
ncbi:unnamed protein product [Acanthosepion pharaonis]|uniref:Uncharacterized protein n=1 Tax=Acanthosepion pharaonis TaxID=158019 RepID=A0A812DPI2_ACAPH|nr:unnamed protein product [Sepia pharaonis]